MIVCFKSIPTSNLVVATSKLVVGLFLPKRGFIDGGDFLFLLVRMGEFVPTSRFIVGLYFPKGCVY